MRFLLKNAFALDISGQKVPIFVLTDGRVIAKVSQTSHPAEARDAVKRLRDVGVGHIKTSLDEGYYEGRHTGSTILTEAIRNDIS